MSLAAPGTLAGAAIRPTAEIQAPAPALRAVLVLPLVGGYGRITPSRRWIEAVWGKMPTLAELALDQHSHSLSPLTCLAVKASFDGQKDISTEHVQPVSRSEKSLVTYSGYEIFIGTDHTMPRSDALP